MKPELLFHNGQPFKLIHRLLIWLFLTNNDFVNIILWLTRWKHLQLHNICKKFEVALDFERLNHFRSMHNLVKCKRSPLVEGWSKHEITLLIVLCPNRRLVNSLFVERIRSSVTCTYESRNRIPFLKSNQLSSRQIKHIGGHVPNRLYCMKVYASEI